jgi:hypothetical protein
VSFADLFVRMQEVLGEKQQQVIVVSNQPGVAVLSSSNRRSVPNYLPDRVKDWSHPLCRCWEDVPICKFSKIATLNVYTI